MPFGMQSRPLGFRCRRKVRSRKAIQPTPLRKASATIAAESGATESELNAMFGWSGYQMAQLYTKKADRKGWLHAHSRMDATLIRRCGGGAKRTRTSAPRKRASLEQRSLPPLGRW